MKIFYVSALCSGKVLNFLFESSSVKPGSAPQKFNRLLVEGLSQDEGQNSIVTLSEIPIPSRGNKKIFWNLSSESEGRICYNYVPMINLPVLKSVIVLVTSFFKLAYLILTSKAEHKIIICDVVSVPLSVSAFFTSKLLRIKSVAIVTDLPSIHHVKKRKIYKNLSHFIIHKFDAYVLLTEQMNEVVNIRNKPYLIMEGLVDFTLKESPNAFKNKTKERILLYAGGLHQANGLKKLIEAFLQLEGENLRFHLYGSGEMEKDMQGYMNLDSRIVYQGVFPNNVIVEKELEATLLINPRPTHEEFTKYSFPSKNMEYMVSGTPMVTTRLPGMPIEYYEYVYLFDDETVPGFVNTLKTILNLNEEILFTKGKRAKEFVLEKKNNRIQAKRILDLCINLK